MGIILLTWLCISAVCDFVYRKCFNWIVILGFFAALSSAALISESHSLNITVQSRVFGFLLAFVIFLVFYLFRVMGAGDVKFAAVLGAWVGWELILPIWALSCAFSVIHGLVVRSNLKYFLSPVVKWRDGTEEQGRRFIPYVTYLSVSAVIVLILDK